MSKDEWKELDDWEVLSHDRYHELLDKTMSVDEHPEDYTGPCFCRLCASYADE